MDGQGYVTILHTLTLFIPKRDGRFVNYRRLLKNEMLYFLSSASVTIERLPPHVLLHLTLF